MQFKLESTPGLKEKYIKHAFTTWRGHRSLDLLRIGGNGRRGQFFFFFSGMLTLKICSEVKGKSCRFRQVVLVKR